MSKGAILEINGEKFILKFGKEYLVGRKTKEQFHDIEIDDSSVDIKHLILDLTQSASPQLFDVCSKHGTFVDGLQIAKLKFTVLAKATKIRFGNVEAAFQLQTESDSGFLEERPNTPTKDNSGIICDTPEHVLTSGSRSKDSLTSTPNVSTVSNANTSAAKSINNFLIPSKLAPRTSLNSTRSNDSFCIPETQHPQDKTHNSTDISVYSNKSKRHSTLNDADDDFFIPETQDVVKTTTIPLSNRARVAFSSDDVNETLSQDDRMPSSQFRICTQDFNGSDEDISNHSGDLLANVPLSMIIPPIQHEAVQVDDFAPVDDGDDNDFVKSVSDEVDKEMSALQWSKQTIDEIAAADGSVTPDELFDVVGSVTADLIRVKTPDRTSSQCSTPDFVGNPAAPSIDDILKEIEKEENEENAQNPSQVDKNRDESTSKPSDENQTKEMEYPPTQAFFKPVTNNVSSRILPQPVASGNEEEEDSDSSLPATQIFSPPGIQPKPASATVNVSNISLPETQAFTPLRPVCRKESLPATQLFSPPPKVAEKTQTPSAKIAGKDHVFALPQPSPKPRMSLKSQASPRPSPKPKAQATPKSTSTDDDLPPTQVFQKDDHFPVVQKVCLSSTLVDSGMQLSENSFKGKINELLNSDDEDIDEVIAPELVKPVTPRHITPIKPAAVTPKEPEPPEPEQKSTTPASTPINKNFRMPTKAANAPNVPAVSIDHFLLTPDFLGREICKDSQLQKEAEVNFRNMLLEKRNKALFGAENSPDDDFAKIDSDDSQDSFVDLLPKRRDLRTKSLTKTPTKKEVKETLSARITRRKSTFSEVKQVVKEEPKKRVRKKKEPKNKKDTTNDSKEKIKLRNEKATDECKKNVEKDAKNDSRDVISSRKTSLVENSISKENSSSRRASVNKDPPSERNTESNSSAIKKSVDEMSKDSVNSSIDAKDKNTKKVDEGKRTRTRRKVEEKPTAPEKIENEKSTRSRASKRTAEPVVKTTSKAAKINKLEEIAVVSKKSSTDDEIGRRITRLKSCTESKVDDKKTTTITRKKEAEPIKTIQPAIKNKAAKPDVVVDLTNSYSENGPNKSRKRKSQEDYIYTGRKSDLSGSQSSAGSSDSDRTLRRKKKIKIAMTSCSQATREILTMYSGRVWDYTEDPKECDVLILEAGNRTYKLLVAIARGVPVVKIDWLKDVIKMRSTDLAFDRYLFDEPNFQKRHQFVMKDVLQLARTKSLFKNLHFMMTPNISPKPDEMKDIITCAGGTILSTIPSPDEDKAFYLVTEKVDCQLWHRYRRASKNVKVVTGISLMASVMQQSLQPLTRVLN